MISVKCGLVINNSQVFWLDDESCFNHEQYYEENTNIVMTKIYNDNITILQRDFIDINIDVLVRKFTILENNFNTNNIKIISCSDKEGDIDRFVCGLFDKELDCILQYTKDTYFATFSKTSVSNYIINDANERASLLNYDNREYEGLSKDSAVVFPINDNTLTIYMGVRENYILAKKMIETVRIIDENLMYEDTKKYWQNVINKANKYNFKNEREKQIYIRSILTLLIYSNNSTGAIIAGCEVDEKVERCGRYAYCWPRDAMYLMNAYNVCGLHEIPNLFYQKFVPSIQSENGMWEQRFYTDGSLGPCWGSQIDQTSSMIIGMIGQYEYIQDESIKMIMHNSIKNGIEYLLSIIDENGMPEDSYDIWETFYGKNQYTLSSIYCALKRYNIFNLNSEYTQKIENLLSKVYDNISNIFWRDDMNYYVKSTENCIVDSSFLGTIYPFDVLNPLDDKVIKTVQVIENKLSSNAGGIKRFENDQYINGNPWIICTLWLCIYYIKKYKLSGDTNDNIKAFEYFDWVTNHSSLHGYLAEQISKDTGEPIWVNGLAWSHGMYIICANELYGNK